MSGDTNAVANTGSGAARNNVRTVAIAVLAAAAGAFIAQNTKKTQLNWLFFDFKASLWLMLLIVLGVGVVIGYFLARSRAKTHS